MGEHIEEIKQLKEELLRGSQRYQIVLDQMEIQVWEYEIPEQRLILTDGIFGIKDAGSVIENVPESLIHSGYIHKDSFQEIRTLYNTLNTGIDQVWADIRTRKPKGPGWQWLRICYTTIYGADGKPERAIAVGKDITRQKQAEIEYQNELHQRYGLGAGSVCSSRVNLTRDRVEVMHYGNDVDQKKIISMRYAGLCSLETEMIANEEDRERYYAVLSREALFKAYSEKRGRVVIEYRIKDSRGHLAWMRSEKRLVSDVLTGDLYAYGMLQNIDEKKTIELGLNRRVERDLLTGTYNKETVLKMMKERVEKSSYNREPSVLILFDVDNYGDQMELSGYHTVEQILQELSFQIFLKFSDPKIVGRIYSNEFAVLLGDFSDLAEGQYLANEICQELRKSHMFPEARIPVSVSAGIVGVDAEYGDFDKVYGMAREVIDRIRKAGGNQTRIYQARIKEGDVTGYKEAEPSLLLQSLFSLASSLEFERAVPQTLRGIAEYYQAERGCLIELEYEGNEIYHVYQWCRPGVRERSRDTFWAVQTEFFNKQSHNLFAIDSESPQRELLERLELRNAIYAILTAGHAVVGYLLLENPGVNSEELNFLDQARHFIGNETYKHQLQIQRKYLSNHDELTRLLNHNSFSVYQSGLVEESLISLGVVSVDINGLRKRNQEFGMSYGDAMVKSIAEVLKDSFQDSQIYRFSGDEFLVICENLSNAVFRENVKLAKRKAEELFPFGISMGTFWTDHDIQLDELLYLANERMLLEKQEYYRRTDIKGKNYDPDDLKRLLHEFKQRRFTMFLQPKLHLKGNRITGAEALVRYVHPEKGIIGPDRFIPQLEQSGLISYIDLFIFEEVCRLLADWKKSGKPLMAVSLNFSRSTLIKEDLMDQMEEILTRYQVDRKYIEIEITERLGMIEKESVALIANQIADLGYRLSLDDFGAKYSNLSILSAVHFNVLKMDKSFGNDVLSNPRTRVVVRNILATCRDLGIESVAEGVENQEQMDFLIDLGCDYIQGYLINKPIPVEEFESEYL